MVAKRRYIVQQEFIAWRPRHRGDHERHLPMRAGLHVFADLDVNGDFILFDMDAAEYETDREAFVDSHCCPAKIFHQPGTPAESVS